MARMAPMALSALRVPARLRAAHGGRRRFIPGDAACLEFCS